MYLANTNMNRIRNNYYENNYTPHMFTNGKDSGSNTTNWKNDPKNYLNKIGLHEISISGYQSGNDIAFNVTSSSIKNTPSGQDIRLFIATVMDLVKYQNSPNGLIDHHNAVIEQIVGDAGKKMSFISGVNYTETFNWSIPTTWVNHSDITWDSDGLKVVAWIQNYTTKEIFQVSELNFD